MEKRANFDLFPKFRAFIVPRRGRGAIGFAIKLNHAPPPPASPLADAPTKLSFQGLNPPETIFLEKKISLNIYQNEVKN